MPGTATNYLENALINHVFRNSAFTSPSAIYVGLLTAVSNAEAGTVTEVSGNGYARQAVTFGAPSNGVSTNTSDIEFPTATGSQGTVVAIGYFDALSGGNLLAYDDGITQQTIVTNNIVRFRAGQLTVTGT